MPSVLIEVRRQYSIEQEVALINAVHDALREAFHIPAHDRNLRLVTHAPHRFACPDDHDGRYTQVTIDAFPGRSLDAKRKLYKVITDNLRSLGNSGQSGHDSVAGKFAGKLGNSWWPRCM